MKLSDPKRDSDLNAQDRCESAAAQAHQEWLQKSRDLLNEVYQMMSKQRIAHLDCVMPNLDEETDMLEWAGISFGNDFSYQLSKSLKVTYFIT